MTSPPDPLRDLYKSLSGKGALPLDPDHPYYVQILQSTPEKDPILMLWQRLDWSESESVNLLTGFRGNGKSTASPPQAAAGRAKRRQGISRQHG